MKKQELKIRQQVNIAWIQAVNSARQSATTERFGPGNSVGR
jgi:hypothetical protein